MVARLILRPRIEARRRPRALRLKTAPLIIAALALLAWALAAAVATGIALVLRGVLAAGGN